MPFHYWHPFCFFFILQMQSPEEPVLLFPVLVSPLWIRQKIPPSPVTGRTGTNSLSYQIFPESGQLPIYRLSPIIRFQMNLNTLIQSTLSFLQRQSHTYGYALLECPSQSKLLHTASPQSGRGRQLRCPKVSPPRPNRVP